MKLSTKPNFQILKNRPTTSQPLPCTYPEDMLRQKRASTPPDHLLLLIRKLAKDQQNQTNAQQSYPPISTFLSNRKPEKTILKKSKSIYRRTKSTEDFITDSDSSNFNSDNSISDNLESTSIPEKNLSSEVAKNSLSDSKMQLKNTAENAAQNLAQKAAQSAAQNATPLNNSVNSISTISGSESDTICSDIETTSETSEFSETQISAQFSDNSTPIKRRSVIFADTIGKPLERVRLISESREDPPKFLLNNNRPTYFSAFSSGYNSTNSDLSPTDDEEEEFFRKSSVYGGGRENSKSDSRSQRDVQSLIKLIAALKHSKNSKEVDKSRNCSYPIDASKTLKVHNTNSLNSTHSKLTHSAFRKFNPCFAQPAINTALLMQRLSKYNVTLEGATITNTPNNNSKNLKFRGTILCRNIDFTKSVKVHYSMNNWASTVDTVARWRRTNLDCTHDIFEFEQDLGEKCDDVKTVQFCIRYNTSSEEFWDNNDGKNYSFQ